MQLNGLKITWLGHATFRIRTPKGRIVLIDPWVMNNLEQLGDIKVTMVHADHSCGIQDGDQLVYGGEACGYVVEFDNGVKIYHAGDTNVFGDMAIIRDLYAPQIAMIPIGDHYTMSPREAAFACNLLKPQMVIPMHFATFPVLTGRPSELSKLVKGVEICEMKPGETIS
jgi:L-ascorbate metabolism protein UlaG (beta-lactamase superfamily)